MPTPRRCLNEPALALLPLFLTLMLTGCGGGGGGGVEAPMAPVPAATLTIEVSPSLGRVQRGVASAFAVNGDRLAGPVTLDDGGQASLEIPAAHMAPVMIEIAGADDADYYDESAATTLPFPADRSMRALLPEPRGSAGVSILTELAVRLVEASGEDLDLELIEIANERIRAALAEDVEDLLTPPTIVDGSTAANSLEDDDAGRLAARLGALAMLAAGDAAPALAVLNQLAADAADGSIDGLAGITPIEDPVYVPASFAADFAQAIRDFAAAFGNDALQTRAAAAAPRAAIGRALRPGATQPGTVNAALVGDYTLTYFEANAGGPYMEGETVSVIIGSDDTLRLGDTILGDPFQRFLGESLIESELNWIDPATGFEYALSFNDTGVFNEINVGDSTQIQDNGFPLFLGQLQDPSGGNSGGDGTPTAAGIVVYAGFEGLSVGALKGQGDGSGDFGFAGDSWIPGTIPSEFPAVVDTSASPLSYSVSGGPVISGGDRALSIKDPAGAGSPTSLPGREFSAAFSSEFFMSFLFRPDAFPSGAAAASGFFLRAVDEVGDYITVNISGSTIDTGGGLAGLRVASEGENAGIGTFGPAVMEQGATYLVVIRLYSSEGSERFDRMDGWVNPAFGDEGTPQITTSGPSNRQPPRIGELRFRLSGRPQQELLFDELRFAGSWDGLFGDPVAP